MGRWEAAAAPCHGRQRDLASSVPIDDPGEIMDDHEDLGIDAEEAELRDTVWTALAGLNPGEREIIELNLRHELHGMDLADTLGVPLNQAHALASRARAQFETSLGALLVARTGREDCPDLDTILDGWNGELTGLLRKRVSRHIGRCDVCGGRKRRELSPAMLLSLLRVAILPAGLRQRVVDLCADEAPEAEDYRAEVAGRAEPFASSGFPVQLARPAPARAHSSYVLTAIAAFAALVLLGGVFLPSILGHGKLSAAGANVLLPGMMGSTGPNGALLASSPAPGPTPSHSARSSFPQPILTWPGCRASASCVQNVPAVGARNGRRRPTVKACTTGR